ncbi:MAG TPA: phenylalanine--tRNA ligase subunit beta [Vicinamibacterales bacterium]|nr:phenylalanine--tRNA ligase subunit beta [Vicinamibacterales bacterium]
MRLVYDWLRDLVNVPDGADALAATLGLRGFEVASVEDGPRPVIDFEITANRPDCLSVLGLAREASAAYGLPLQPPDQTRGAAREGAPIDVEIEDADACPRYCAQLFEVAPGPSPDWLRDRLEAAGVRSISAIVDVTNYVMIEIGQPMHAFDVSALAGRSLRIRRARPGERLRTLDGVDRALSADMLVIADAARPQAIGGVMGGAASEVGPATTLIALESAYFKPASIRQTSKRLGLRTEASTRFERGADIDAPPAGIARAAALLRQLGAGTAVGPLVDRYPSPRPRVSLTLRGARLTRVLGMDVPPADVPGLLEPLGFGVAAEDGAPAWRVEVPTFRVDVQREVDLIEEVARHYGYDRLPATFPALAAPQPPPDRALLQERVVRQVLTASGLSEAMTFAFVERAMAQPFAGGPEAPAIANPLSEKFAVLRPSLLPGLLEACAWNRRREQRDVRLFEAGARFTPAGERRAVGIVWCGAAGGTHWSTPARPVDFYDVKGIVEVLCGALGVPVTTEAATSPAFVDGRTAEVTADGARVGVIGQIDPAVADARGFPSGEPLFAAEIDLDAVAARAPADTLRAEPLPRFPSIARDLSILVDDSLPAAAVRGTIRSAAPATLVHVVEFDRYRGKGIPEGRVSLSLRLTFRSPERTLTDAEADEAMHAIVAALAARHSAERR